MTAARAAIRWLAAIPAFVGAALVLIGILWTEIPQLAAGGALVLVGATWWRIVGGRWAIRGKKWAVGAQTP